MGFYYLETELSHHGVKGQKWGVRKQKISAGKVIGKTYSVNENIERKKSAIASKFGLKKKAQTYKNNADYYKKTANDLASGKVGKPRTKYQKAMRWLGKTDFATRAIIRNDIPGVKLTKQQQARALHEQHLMRSADGWYKKKAKRMAAMKVADLAIKMATK